MVLFADGGGLFLNKWYWDPIFRAIAALPFVGIVAFVAAFVTRRRCLLPDAGCRRVRRPEGMRVLIARSRWGVDASAVLGRTLVSVLTVDVDEAAVLAYYDALAPVAAGDIEFTGA
jgi:hypothetical protein